MAYLLERGDSSKAMLRSVTRELLAAAVLRNIMFYFTPYTLNKVRSQPAVYLHPTYMWLHELNSSKRRVTQ